LIGQNVRKFRRHVRFHRQPPHLCGAGFDLRAGRHDLSRIDLRPGDFVRARFYARQVEQVDHEVDLPVALGGDSLQIFALFVRAHSAAL
jgi:hypothetical protein